jgi:xanthine permease XanP
VMRIGVKKKVEATINPEESISAQVFTLLERQGEAWGARKEVIFRMETALIEAGEIIAGHLLVSGPVRIILSFDEYNLDAEISWEGKILEIPDRRPGEEELLDDPLAFVRLGGYLVRSQADSVRSVTSGTTSTVKIHIEH